MIIMHKITKAQDLKYGTIILDRKRQNPNIIDKNLMIIIFLYTRLNRFHSNNNLQFSKAYSHANV